MLQLSPFLRNVLFVKHPFFWSRMNADDMTAFADPFLATTMPTSKINTPLWSVGESRPDAHTY
jgi:hypothetical protein